MWSVVSFFPINTHMLKIEPAKDTINLLNYLITSNIILTIVY